MQKPVKTEPEEGRRTDTLSGHELREMFAAATGWLEKSVPDIDALNVFPVPDGDTGTNMFLTMRSTMEEAYRVKEESASAIAQAMAHGALMGARGNSGVILSQIWRGFARAVGDKEAIVGVELGNAFIEASRMAYQGLNNPVEGTMLTVMKEAARAAQRVSRSSPDILDIMEAAVNTAAETVANTPTLLPVLREAGVVDAGGHGLYTILDGAYRYLKGEAEEMQYRQPRLVASNVPLAARMSGPLADEVPYGYCTEFIIKGKSLNPDRIRRRLSSAGLSVIVVGDETMVRVHTHTEDPGVAVRYGTRQGTLHQVSIRNMDEQHQDFLRMQRGKAPEVDMGVIAVVSGDGLVEVFRSLGITAIVPGGQTMNPSTRDILQVVNSIPQDKVIILPNDKNVIATAQQVQALTSKKVAVVPSKTVPQGISALLAVDYEANFRTNAETMTRALAAVRTVSITRAIRSTQLGGLNIKKRQFLGFSNGDLVAVGDTAEQVLDETLGRLPVSQAEVATIYHGETAKPAAAEVIAGHIREKYPSLQVEVVRSGQPHYDYIVSLE